MSIGQKNDEALDKFSTKVCPFCLSEIPLEATRCAHCTSVLEEK